MKASEHFKEAFKRGWDEEISKLPPEPRKVIEGMRPYEVAIAMFMVLLNPLVWLKVLYAMIKGGIDGFKEYMSRK